MNERCEMFGDCPNPPIGRRVCTVNGVTRSSFLICAGHAEAYPVQERTSQGVTLWRVVPL